MTQSKKKILLLNESVIIDTYFLYEFLKRLTTPFNKTEAYKLGIIDESGKILKKRSQLKTRKERKAFTIFDLLAWNLKKIIERLPFGKTRLASYAAAVFLIKEQKYLEFYAEDRDLLTDSFVDFYDIIEFDNHTKYDILKLIDEFDRQSKFNLLFETPANVVGSGNIAGAAPGEQPAVHKKTKGVKRRKKVNVLNTGEKDVDIRKTLEGVTTKRKGFREFIN
jgi:hypothetical protein